MHRNSNRFSRYTFLWPSLVVALLLFLLAGCDRDAPAPSAPETEAEFSESFDFESLESLAAEPDRGLATLAKGSAKIVRLPAGSVDGLAAAIAAAGRGGAVIVEAGLHTESATVMITKSVKIIGEPGAMLHVNTRPWPVVPVLQGALHVKNADHVVIWGLEIRPTEAVGGTAVLLERSRHAIIGRNAMYDHQFSVMVEQGDRATIWGNRIVASSAWQTQSLLVHGVVAANGRNVRVVSNDISNGLIGIWACDKQGLAMGNYLHGNTFGVMLCKVPDALFPLPGGGAIGSQFPGTKWLVQANNAVGNFFAGYLVIDGANNNLLRHNAASNNGQYDIELAGDSNRFGFFTPLSFENTVIAGNKHQIIKDCGVDNKVVGGQLVDNSQDPCF